MQTGHEVTLQDNEEVERTHRTKQEPPMKAKYGKNKHNRERKGGEIERTLLNHSQLSRPTHLC